MTEPATDLTVRRSIDVAVPLEHAFQILTSRFDSWWPIRTHHIGPTEPAAPVIEPVAGGRCGNGVGSGARKAAGYASQVGSGWPSILDAFRAEAERTAALS